MSPISIEVLGESRAALRFALAVALASALVALIKLPVPALLPVLTAALARPGSRPLPGKVVIIVVAVTALFFGVGRFATELMLLVPTMVFLAVGLGMYLCFYFHAAGVNSVVITLGLLAILMVPALGAVSLDVARVLASAITTLLLGAIACSHLAGLLLPYEEGEVPAGPKADAASLAPGERHRRALMLVGLVLPVHMAVIIVADVSYVTGVVYLGLLALSGSPSSGWEQGRGWLVANAIGGVVAFAVVLFSLILDSQPILVLIIFEVALLFGLQMAKHPAQRSMLGTAMSAVLLVATASDAAEKLGSRLLQIAIVVLYSFIWYSALTPSKPREALA